MGAGDNFDRYGVDLNGPTDSLHLGTNIADLSANGCLIDLRSPAERRALMTAMALSDA